MQRYLEIRTTPDSSTAGADVARHLLGRQHLGKTMVVCDKPVIMMSVVRKYWLKLSRNLQRERASTLNAEKILQLTYDITHMQHMGFVARPYTDAPQADVFFVTPNELGQLPPNCFNFYVLAAPHDQQLQDVLPQLPERSLVVDYSHATAVANAPLLPKFQLEQLAIEEWQEVDRFFQKYHIDARRIADNAHRADLVDEAVDVILNTSSQFLRIADDFLLLLRQAQPLHVPHSQQQLYDLVGLLHRRIGALTPGTLSQQFTQLFGHDGPMAQDVAVEIWSLAEGLRSLQQAQL